MTKEELIKELKEKVLHWQEGGGTDGDCPEDLKKHHEGKEEGYKEAANQLEEILKRYEK
jgi:hypothetical protein